MEYLTARFWIKHCGTTYLVTFEPEYNWVTVDTSDKRLLQVDNHSRRYKPCVTHALELVEQAVKKPAKNNFAKQRQKVQRPKLSLVK